MLKFYTNNFFSAKRTQFRFAAAMHRGLFQPSQIQIPEQAETGARYELLNHNILPTDIICESLTVKNTEYKVGMLVVLEVSSQDKITVGWVKKIVVRGMQSYFIVLTRTCVRQKLRYFRCTDRRSMLEMRNHEELRCYKPLIPRGNEETFVFFLHGKLIDDPVA